MKIIMFQYNRQASAIIQECTMAEENKSTQKLRKNCFLANGYTDRFLWEEAASLRPKKPENYPIPGIWQ